VSGYPWLGTVLLALPGGGLAAAAGVVGLQTPAGVALAGAAGLYLLLGLLVLQPRLEQRAAGGSSGSDAAGEFFERALAATDVGEIARELRLAVRQQLGTTHTLLVAPSPTGVVAISASSVTPVDEATDAFLWLGEQQRPITRAELQGMGESAGARSALELAAQLDAEMLLPLIHRGVLLGLAVIGYVGGAPSGARGFCEAIRVGATVAMANTFLDAEARGGSELVHTFDLATAMQESLMPDDKIVRRPTFELRGVFSPVAECGGDLWAWRELGKGRLLLVIADATGHGAAPALLAAVAKGAIDANWQLMGAELDPGTLLTALNRSIHRAGRTRYMMTAFAAVLDKSAGELRYANAAQNFPFFIDASGQVPKVEVLVARGNTLGAAAEVDYETHVRPMRMGDKLLLYTDGIVDAVSPTLGPFGERRLRAVVQAIAAERYSAGATLVDDITMCAAEFGPTGAGAKS